MRFFVGFGSCLVAHLILACAQPPERVAAPQAGPSAPRAPSQEVTIPEPPSSSSAPPVVDAGVAPVASADASSAQDASPKYAARGRCRVAGEASLDGWGGAEWRECTVQRCDAEKGLATKLRATVTPKPFTSGVTDVARVKIENTTDTEVRVPLKWGSGEKFLDPGAVSFLKSDGTTFDTWDSACLGLATCAELVLEPHASYAWNAIAVPMKRRSTGCDPLRPTTPLPAGAYTLRVDTRIDTDTSIEAKAAVTVAGAGKPSGAAGSKPR